MPFRVYLNSPQQVDRATGLSRDGGARIMGVALQDLPGLEAAGRIVEIRSAAGR